MLPKYTGEHADVCVYIQYMAVFVCGCCCGLGKGVKLAPKVSSIVSCDIRLFLRRHCFVAAEAAER